MNFVQFAHANEVLIKSLVNDGQIHRCPTIQHPHKHNGAYKYCGDWGFVQAWDASDSPAVWFGEDTTPERRERIQRDMRQEMQQEQEKRHQASILAADIIKKADLRTHPYLERKGFKAEVGLVDFDGRLVVPMRDCNDYRRINSVQFIDDEGNKKFLTGGKAKGSIYKIGSEPDLWLCEGLATGLSIRSALKLIGWAASVVVCFSAGNLKHMADVLKGKRYVFADNDASGTGQRAAEASELPWCMSQTVGHDANDDHLRSGILTVAQMLMEVRRR